MNKKIIEIEKLREVKSRDVKLQMLDKLCFTINQ